MNDGNQREKLYYQIQEQFGKVVYSYTCHLKEAKILGRLLLIFKWAQLVLSAGITCGIFVTLLGKNRCSTILSAIASTVLFILNTYLKDATLAQDEESHRKTSNELWKIREAYISLLTDFDTLKLDEIKSRRDELVDKTAKIYDEQLHTSVLAYWRTQKALKNNQEQYFSQEEIDMMLPKSLRIDGECKDFNESK